MSYNNLFREWLVNLVAGTRWARVEGDVEKISKHLGVRPEVLEEARRRGERRAIDTCAFVLFMPEEIFKLWKRTLELQGLEGGLLLRGLIQVLLTSAKKPTWTNNWWMVGGKRYNMGNNRKGQNWPWKVKALISRGADRALVQIADHHRTTKTSLIRGQVIDYLEGRSPKVILMPSDAMANDPKKYTNLWGL